MGEQVAARTQKNSKARRDVGGWVNQRPGGREALLRGGWQRPAKAMASV